MSLPASTPSDDVFERHRGGKIGTELRVPLRDRHDLALAYTPGVAEVSLAIRDRPGAVWDYTGKGGTVAVVTDGTAVLGLGDIGPAAALPVMEGKAALFKAFAGIDAVPICLATTDVDEIVETVVRIAPGFGGINLEDIAAPRCFDVEDRLRERLDVPVFHDDQHGTAIVALAALRNAAAVVGKPFDRLRVVICGAGAAGVAIARILVHAGVADVVVTDRDGIVDGARLGAAAGSGKLWLATHTNGEGRRGGLGEALDGADVLIGVSGPDCVAETVLLRMAPGAIVFALANPVPEIDPAVAARHAAVVATGRSDLPNQINNVLAFPGVFRGALDARASAITEPMKLAAAEALAGCVAEPRPDYVVPSPFDPAVAPAVARAVAAAARRTGVARR